MTSDEAGWRHRGSCNQHNPEWWFPTDIQTSEAQAAVAVCLACPVRRQCADWARDNMSLCAGAIYGGVYYTAGGGSNRTVRRSKHQPTPRSPRVAA